MGPIVITDASVLINLVASGVAGEILSGCGMDFKICPDVIREVKVLRDRETGEEHAIDLEPIFAAGLLNPSLTVGDPESQKIDFFQQI
jgi:hypothetical protein